jgi:hypothetical protein
MPLKLTTVTYKTESDIPELKIPLVRHRPRMVDNAKENIRDILRYRLIKLGEDKFQFVSTATNFQRFIKVGWETSTLYHEVGSSDYYFLTFSLTFVVRK